MKKTVAFTLASLLATQVMALDLNEAIDIALKKNHSIQEQSFVLEESKENISLEQAALLPSIDLSYTYNDRDKTSTGQIEEDSTATAKLSYNLFNGFKDLKTMQSAEFLAKASSFQFNAVSQDIILDTKSAYIDVLDKQKNLTTLENAYSLFSKQYEDAKIRFDQGLLAKNDLLQVNVNLLDAKQNVTSAKKDLKVARLNLSNFLGGKDLNSESIQELSISELEVKPYTKDILENRSEINVLKMNIESMNSNISGEKGDYLPKLDASVSYSEFGDDFSPSGRDGYPDNQTVATLNASWNLYEGGANQSQIQIYLAQKNQVLAQLERTRLDINLQYERAKLELDVANENFDTSKVSLEQAKENYAIVDNRFKEGLSSTTDLIDANYLLSQAKQRYFRSYYDKFLAVATLKRILEVK